MKIVQNVLYSFGASSSFRIYQSFFSSLIRGVSIYSITINYEAKSMTLNIVLALSVWSFESVFE